MPTFQELLGRSRIELGFVLRIRGLPYLFASFARPSTAWDDIDGEAYTWHECIDSTEIADAAETIDAFSGLPSPGELSLQLRITETVRELLDFELAATAGRCTIAGDVDPSDTTIDVDDASGLNSGGDFHAGAECIDYTGKTSTSITGCTRGRYGSTPQRFRGSFESAQRFGIGGPRASNHPLTLAGRKCDLWLVHCYRADGVRRPFAEELDAEQNAKLERGELVSITPDYGAGAAAVVIASKARLLERDTMTSFPQARLGHGIARGVQIDVDSCRIAFAIWQTVAGSPAAIRYEGRLQRDMWSGGAWTGTPEDVPFGVYSGSDIGRWIAFTMQTMIGTAGITVRGGGSGSPELFVVLRLAGQSSEPHAEIVLEPCADSVLAELGFKAEQLTAEIVSSASGSDWTVQHTWTADRGPCAARLTARGLRRLYYHGPAELAFTASPGWQCDDGTDAPACVLVGEELIEFSGAGSFAYAAGVNLPYLQTSRRACYGSHAAELEVAEDDDPIDVRQVVALPRTSAGRALLYLAQSDGAGADYNQGWAGAGAALEAADFDEPSFERSEELRDVCVVERKSLRDIAAALCPQTQSAIITRRAGALALVDLDPITDDERTDATPLVLDDFVGVPTWDAGEDRVVNVVDAVNLGFDSAKQEGKPQTLSQGTSGGTYGYQAAVELDMRWSGPIDASQAALLSAFDRLVAKFGERFATSSSELARAIQAWRLDLLAPVLITHPMLPNGAGGLGMVERLARLWSVRRVYQSTGGARASTTFVVHDLEKSEGRCRLAPSARSSAVAGAVVTIDPDTYSAGELADVASFRAGMRVRIAKPGAPSTAVERTISSIVGNDATMNSAVGLAHPVVVEFASWDDVDETTQQPFAYAAHAKRWS